MKLTIELQSRYLYPLLGSLLYTARTETNKTIKAMYQEIYEDVREQAKTQKDAQTRA